MTYREPSAIIHKMLAAAQVQPHMRPLREVLEAYRVQPNGWYDLFDTFKLMGKSRRGGDSPSLYRIETSYRGPKRRDGVPTIEVFTFYCGDTIIAEIVNLAHGFHKDQRSGIGV